VLAFRSQALGTVALYSLLSFLRFALIFYFWLLVFLAVNRTSTQPDAITRLLRLHLGRMGGWPPLAQILVPCLLGALLWVCIHGLLVQTGVTARVNSTSHLAAQALLVGAALCFTLKWVILLLLLLHIVNSYVYLGNNPVWEFVSATSRGFLAPLDRMPLRIARVDLAPFLVMLAVVLCLHWLPNYAAWALARHSLTIWPQ